MGLIPSRSWAFSTVKSRLYLGNDTWKVDGIWLSIVVAKMMAVVVTVLFLKGKQKKYHY